MFYSHQLFSRNIPLRSSTRRITKAVNTFRMDAGVTLCSLFSLSQSIGPPAHQAAFDCSSNRQTSSKCMLESNDISFLKNMKLNARQPIAVLRCRSHAFSSLYCRDRRYRHLFSPLLLSRQHSPKVLPARSLILSSGSSIMSMQQHKP